MVRYEDLFQMAENIAIRRMPPARWTFRSVDRLAAIIRLRTEIYSALEWERDRQHKSWLVYEAAND